MRTGTVGGIHVSTHAVPGPPTERALLFGDPWSPEK